MPASSDPSLLHEIAALRAHLAACLRQVERLERRLRGEPVPAEDPVGPLADPFEQVLPAHEPGPEWEAPSTPAAAPRPHGPTGRFTIRDMPLAAPSHNPVADAPRAAAWEQEALHRSGDGSSDPFAFLSVSARTPSRDEASEVYRGVNALLGGLDVTTQDEEI